MKRLDYIFFATITLLAWGIILWDHFHEGVPSHYLFQDKNMPAISNWWGALIIPILTYIAIYRNSNRPLKINGTDEHLTYSRKTIIAFIGSFVFGITVSILFTYGYDDITGYVMLSIFPLALIFPFFRSEYLLGLILGMYYTFGAFIPTMAGLIICGLCALLYRWIRPIFIRPFLHGN